MFDFIESELRDVCLVALPSKIGQSGNGGQQGQFTKAGSRRVSTFSLFIPALSGSFSAILYSFRVMEKFGLIVSR